MRRGKKRFALGTALATAMAAVLVGAIGAGCTTADEEPSGAGSALEQATGVEWIVTTNPKTGAITFAAPKNGPFALPAGPPPDEATLRFLETYKAIFKMHDPRLELALERIDRPADGSAHIRFVQKVAGLPVFGGTWTAHLDSAGRVTSMSGNYAVGAHAVVTKPELTPEAVGEAAKARVAAKKGAPSEALTTGTPTLEVFAADGIPILGWTVKVASKPGTKLLSLTLHVADATGKVLVTMNEIHSQTASGPGPETYPPFSVDAPPITFPVSDDALPRLDAVGPGGVRMTVVRLLPGPVGTDPGGNDGEESFTIDSDPPIVISGPIVAANASPWSDATEPRGAAIAAQAHAKIVLDYFAEHTWGPEDRPFLGVDGTGERPVLSIIDDDNAGPVNAYWWPSSHAMHYGNGAPERGIFPMSASLDVVAHELAHAVTSFTSKLGNAEGDTDFAALKETAAINESMSDVFAALITHRIRNDDAVDFTTGEDGSLDRVPHRSMIQPELTSLVGQGGISTYEQFEGEDNTEAHHASNLASHAFYLLTHGATHERTRVKVPCGIGWAAADRLYWQLETKHMTSTETFHALAEHSLTAARELGINTLPVACAWVAVGVLTDDEAKTRWNVTCERDGDGGTDAGYDSGNILVTAPAQLVECPVSLTGGSVSLGGQ